MVVGCSFTRLVRTSTGFVEVRIGNYQHSYQYSGSYPSTEYFRPGGIRYMMSTSNGVDHKWNAKNVRDTFLDYFKKNGHTFGESIQ